ncbi:helix-turn-helix domain-containing protein [Amycolatopsis sp. H20-H5]|uniref:helix-turn-helix domain-containing protein n=1 Tax=Amycolatopsis sp. H20-H5 TaxID=3046309 RepID=UPI002DBE5227|nr:hypothetical protein [Amycolatopsis sp. H20-H5]MEC3980255.1 hypothetical protein [Amycolatopsis sp. H20-H5]
MATDPRIEFDAETLHQVFSDPAQAAAWLDKALGEPRMGYHDRLVTGSSALLLGRCELAEAELSAAKAAATPVQLRLVTKELASVHAAQGRFELAEAELAVCLSELEPTHPGRHLFVEAAGVCAYDAGDWTLARRRFAEGLDLLSHTRSDAMTASLRTAFDAADACVTAQSMAVELNRLSGLETETTTRLRDEPDEVLELAEAAVAGTGPSEGPVFAGMAAASPDESRESRLFEALFALRHHRADAHAAAWLAEGLTADAVRALTDDDPLRKRIETVTDRVASRAYRHLTVEQRAGLLDGLRRR